VIVGKFIAIFLLVGALNPAFASQAQSTDAAETKRPRVWASIAEPSGTKEGPETPLWNRVKPSIAAAAKGQVDSFNSLLIKGADFSFTKGQAQASFDPSEIVKIAKSCMGPFLQDEGKDWLQFSWVCPLGASSPVGEYLNYGLSPELAATFFYDEQKVKSIMLSEPGWVPGAKRLRMDAYDLMKADQK